jgi:hypothetical protein
MSAKALFRKADVKNSCRTPSNVAILAETQGKSLNAWITALFFKVTQVKNPPTYKN